MKVNFCVFNHLRIGITDQIWFLEALCAEQGISFQVSEFLKPDALNIMLENFIETDAEIVDAFCRKWNKSIGLIMSEHVELENGQLSFNGTPLSDGGYIINKAQRFFSMCSLTECVFATFVLGELPRLNSFSNILPTHTIYRLPYPQINPESVPKNERQYDLVFTGSLTDYRRRVIERMHAHYEIFVTELLPEDERTEIYRLAKIAVNIPQTEDWPWISPMRVLFGLRHRVASAHHGALDDTTMSKVVLNIRSLEEAVAAPETTWAEQCTAYNDLVRSDLNPSFPRGLFETWSEIEDA